MHRAVCSPTFSRGKKNKEKKKENSRSTFHRAHSSPGMEGKTPKGTYTGILDDDDDPLPRKLTRVCVQRRETVLNDTKER